MNDTLFFLILFLLGMTSISKSQDKELKSVTSRFSYSVYAGIGRSIFKSNIDGPTKFPTLEFRVGGSVNWLLSDHFEITGRLILGLKVAREKDTQPYPYYGFYIAQNEMAGRNHYFVEIPVLFQYRFLHPKINLGTGIAFRQFLNIESETHAFDPLNGKTEVGVIARVAYRVNDRINIGLEQYFPLTNLYTSAGTIDGKEFNLLVKNMYTQITFEYRLTKN